jgi:hypothetical protein
MLAPDWSPKMPMFTDDRRRGRQLPATQIWLSLM